MLKALNLNKKPVLARGAQKGQLYTCPSCGDTVIFKKGALVVPHYAHKPGSICSLSTGESYRHLEMKEQIYDFFSRLYSKVDLEVAFDQDHRADVVVIGKRFNIVVECQASAISIPEIEKRTKYYNHLGYVVLWVWDSERFHWIDSDGWIETRVPADVSYCQRISYGKVYLIDKVGTLCPYHFSFRTKNIAHPYKGVLGEKGKVLETSNGFNFFQFDEPLFWKTKAEKRNELLESLQVGLQKPKKNEEDPETRAELRRIELNRLDANLSKALAEVEAPLANQSYQIIYGEIEDYIRWKRRQTGL